jgi:DNA-directed RNA polymerase specialized sigma24 family protein
VANEDTLAKIADRLETLVKIQALAAVRHLPSKKEKILFLAEAGLTPKEVAVIVSTTAAAVSQTIYAAKKAKTTEKSDG